MSKWIVQLKGVSKTRFVKISDLEGADDEADSEAIWELSVIHTSDKYGQKSWGWDDLSKIILPDLNPGDLIQRKFQMKQAVLMAAAFNDAKLIPPVQLD